MTTQTLPMPASSAAGRMARLAGTVVLRVAAFVRAYKHRRDMEMLGGFDDRMLRDIGLTRGDLRDAVAEPLWRDPTRVLVTRVGERRRARLPAPARPRLVTAPPLAPREPGMRPEPEPDWSSHLFPARSRYY